MIRRLCAGLLALAAAISPAAAETLHVGYQKTGTLVIVKQQHRLEDALKPLGVTVQWAQFQSGPTLLEAMNAGAIDFGYTGDTPPVFAQAADVDMVYVARLPVSGRDEGFVVHKNSPIKTVADLRGKRVAFTKGTSAHYMVAHLLEAAGLRMTDIRPVYLPPADAREAFRSGSVDAWAVWDPFFAVAQEDADARTLTDGQGAPTSAFLLARRAFAKNHPEIVMTALRTVDQAAAWSEQHQDKLAAIMAQVTGVDLSAEAVAAARAAYHYDLLDDADIKQQQGLADTFAALRIIPAPIDVRADVWTPPKGVSQ